MKEPSHPTPETHRIRFITISPELIQNSRFSMDLQVGDLAPNSITVFSLGG